MPRQKSAPFLKKANMTAMNDMSSPTQIQVQAARKSARLTQAECAGLLHVNLRTWARWESGESRMPHASWDLFLLLTNTPETTA